METTPKAKRVGAKPESDLTEIKKGIEAALKNLTEITETYNLINKNIKNLDQLFVKDITDRYGFNAQYMYYIGAASGRIYRKPINTEIADLISRIDTLTWRDIQKINQYFMS